MSDDRSKTPGDDSTDDLKSPGTLATIQTHKQATAEYDMAISVSVECASFSFSHWTLMAA